MPLKITYLLIRWTFGLAVLMFAGDQAKNAELLVLRHENAVLRKNAGRVRYEPGDRAWFAALMRFMPARRWAGVFPVTPTTLLAWQPGDGPQHRPARCPPGEGKPDVGIPADSWRAGQAGRDGRAIGCL